MVKVVVCLKRKAGMSSEDFHRHWREQHGPLFMGIPELSRNVKRYVQSHSIEGPLPGFGGESAFDGFAEMWFDSLDDVEKTFANPRYLDTIRPDEMKFLDLHKCRVSIVEETVMHPE